MKIAVVGAGASGLMCAGILASYGHNVDLFESNEKVGKKLFITGKGRCNVTNKCAPDEILNNIVTNPKFMFSSINNFSSDDTMNYFENLGVSLKVERGNRVFPASDKSSDIIKALERYCIKNGVNILLNNKVLDLQFDNGIFNIHTICGSYHNYSATILCTGGKTYSATGSTGDGYKFAKKFGHTISEIKPALVPIILNDSYIKSLEGLSLKNVKLISKINDKAYKELFGEMLFTNKGISGPIALSMSSYINKKNNISLYIDFKPALSKEQLCARINRDISNLYNSQINTLLEGLLPKKIVPILLTKLNINTVRKNRTLNVKEIEDIVNCLKNFDLQYNGLDKLDFGIITSGGVNINEVNPKTMESKLVKGLYICGELLDVDALTGGFNLQIAFSTAAAVANALKGDNNDYCT